jgi:hypothetical protein
MIFKKLLPAKRLFGGVSFVALSAISASAQQNRAPLETVTVTEMPYQAGDISLTKIPTPMLDTPNPLPW